MKPKYYWFVDNDYKKDFESANTKEPQLFRYFESGKHNITCVLFDDNDPSSFFLRKEGLAICHTEMKVEGSLKLAVKTSGDPSVGEYVEASVDLDPEIAAEVRSYGWALIGASEDDVTGESREGVRTAVPSIRRQLTPRDVGAKKFALVMSRKNAPGAIGSGHSDAINVKAAQITYSGQWTKTPTPLGFVLERAPFKQEFGKDIVVVGAIIQVQTGEANHKTLNVREGASKEPFESGYYKGEITKFYKSDWDEVTPRLSISGYVEAVAVYQAVDLWIVGSSWGTYQYGKEPGPKAVCEAQSKNAYDEMLKTIRSMSVKTKDVVNVPTTNKTDMSSAKTNNENELSVKVEADTLSLLAGEKAIVKAFASGGMAPYIFAWQGQSEIGSDPQSVTVVGDKEGKKTVSVTVTDSAGKSLSTSVDINVGQVKVEVEKLSPAGNAICMGTKAAFKAEISTGNRDRSYTADFKLLWQPHPEVTFDPFESVGRMETSAIFNKLGKSKLWVELYTKVNGQWTKLTESPQLEIDVVKSEYSLAFTPADPHVGEEITCKLVSKPPLDENTSTIRWLPAPRNGVQTTSQKSDEMKFYATDDKPVKIEALIVGKPSGEDLGKAEGSVTARKYEVTVSPPRRLGPTPRVWKEGVGLVEVPDAFATYQDVFFNSDISPKPSGELRYKWKVSPDGLNVLNPNSRETKVNASRKDAYELSVEVSSSGGVVLGNGTASLSITISDEDQKNSKQKGLAARKLAEAKQAVEGGELDKGIDLAGEAVNLDPKYSEASQCHDRWAKERNEVMNSLKAFESALSIGDLKAAQTHLNKAEGLHPKYATVVAAAGRLKQALEIEAKVQRLVSEGFALEKNGQLEPAIEKFNEALAVLPDKNIAAHIRELELKVQQKAKAQALINEGYALEKQKDLEGANDKYREAVKLVPDQQLSNHIKELEAKIAINKKVQALINEGYALEKQKDLEGANSKYREAIRLVPDPKLSSHVKELEEKIVLMKKAQSLVNEGYKLEKQGRLADAVGKYEAAVALVPDAKLSQHIAQLKATIAKMIADSRNAQSAQKDNGQQQQQKPQDNTRLNYDKRQPKTTNTELSRSSNSPPPASRPSVQSVLNVSGTYVCRISDGGDALTMTLTLSQDGSRLSGTLKINPSPPDMAANQMTGTINGNRISIRSKESIDSLSMSVSSDGKTISMSTPEDGRIVKFFKQ